MGTLNQNVPAARIKALSARPISTYGGFANQHLGWHGIGVTVSCSMCRAPLAPRG